MLGLALPGHAHWQFAGQPTQAPRPPRPNIALFIGRYGVAHPLPYRARYRGTGAPDKAWTTPPPASSLFGGKAWRSARGCAGGLCGGYRALPSPSAEHGPFLSGTECRESPQTVGSATQIEKGDVRERWGRSAHTNRSREPLRLQFHEAAVRPAFALPGRHASPRRGWRNIRIGPVRRDDQWQEHI